MPVVAGRLFHAGICIPGICIAAKKGICIAIIGFIANIGFMKGLNPAVGIAGMPIAGARSAARPGAGLVAVAGTVAGVAGVALFNA